MHFLVGEHSSLALCLTLPGGTGSFETGLGSRYRICICALASTNVSVYLLYTLVYPSKGEFFWVLKSNVEGAFLVVQWLGLCAFIAGGMSSIPG